MKGGNVAVIVATRGRPALVRELVERLGRQTRPVDGIFVVGSQPADVAEVRERPGLTIAVGRSGLAHQRNDGLALAGEGFGTIVFFDDDFVPSRFWLERVTGLFRTHPDLACLTGTVLLDGARLAGIDPREGEAIVALRDAAPLPETGLQDGFGPYGCNMAFRASAIAGLAFDERLPLYGWLEDADFGAQVARRGRCARADGLWGVHLGSKAGRERGVRIGYAQVANPCYLIRKGTLTVPFSANLMLRNLAANTVRSLAPEPYVDRIGRLRGNLLAAADVVRGRFTPERAAAL